MIHSAFVIALSLALFIGLLSNHVSKRSYALERQDKSPEEGRYTWDEYEDMMTYLASLNSLHDSGYNATLRGFSQLSESPSKILEIGFGRGDFSILLAKTYPKAQILGVDAHQFSVDVANKNLRLYNERNSQLLNVRFEHVPVENMTQTDDSFDVITTTFVNHHIFPDEEFVNFLKYVRRVGRTAFIFNDLYRSPICYAETVIFNEIIRRTDASLPIQVLQLLNSFSPLAALQSIISILEAHIPRRSGYDLFLDGGVLSVARSFTLEELKSHFAAAGYPSTALSNCEVFTTPCRVVCFVDLKK
jgi:2-polyprenyl-3-methyl-5-hydroxy-6-metoxy-1,4-benzoquinol methylase